MLNLSTLLKRWLAIGVSNYSGRIQRRLVLTNALVMLTMVNCTILLAVLAIGDFRNLVYPCVFLAVAILLMTMMPQLHRINEYAGSLANLVLWLTTATGTCLMLGSDTGTHLCFIAGMTSAALIFGTRHNAISIFSIATQVTLFWYFDRYVPEPMPFVTVTPFMTEVINAQMIICILTTIFGLVSYAFGQMYRAEALLQQEYEYSERLLANMMPQSIASQLKREPQKTIADQHDEATILFADIVGFTERSHHRPPDEVVEFLNKLFTRFDNLATSHGIEKIKTLGDAFMVAGGMPDEQPDHCRRVALMALDMIEEANKLGDELGEDVDLRVGIHSGPVVAGVIGTKKPFYDVWGDTVNMAARLETTGLRGRIQVSSQTKRLLENEFVFERRGIVDVKGAGDTEVWYLLGQIDPKAADSTATDNPATDSTTKDKSHRKPAKNLTAKA